MCDWTEPDHSQSPVVKKNVDRANEVRAGSRQVLVPGMCLGSKCYFFVDSGSSVNLVSFGLIKRLSLEKWVRPCTTKLSSFTMDNVPTRGLVKLIVQIAGLEHEAQFVVTDLLDTEFLIGDPFLRDMKVSVDYEESCLKFPGGSSVKFKDRPLNVTEKMRIRCNKTTVLQPNSIQFIQGKLTPTTINYQGLVEPYQKTMESTGVLFAEAVVHSEGRKVPIKCVNATYKPVVIYRNKLFAFLQPMGDHVGLHSVKRINRSPVQVNYDNNLNLELAARDR